MSCTPNIQPNDPSSPIAEMDIVNVCPHDVNYIVGTVFDPVTRKTVGGMTALTIPASGTVASASSSVLPSGYGQVLGIPFPLYSRQFSRVSDLPDTPKDRYYIVSSLYAQAAKFLHQDTSHLLTPYGSVVDENGKVIGCTGFICYNDETDSPNQSLPSFDDLDNNIKVVARENLITEYARQLNQFTLDFDPYEYRDLVDDPIQEYDRICNELRSGKVDDILKWLESVISDPQNTHSVRSYAFALTIKLLTITNILTILN